MPVSKTTPGRLGARVIAPIRVAFRQRNDVGTQDEGTFAAQWLAYALPCQRFADALAGICADLGRCGSLLLHRDGLAPSTPCRSPGALRFAPETDLTPTLGHVRDVCQKRKLTDIDKFFAVIGQGMIASGKTLRLPCATKAKSHVRAQGSVLPRFPSGVATPASLVNALKAAAGLRPRTCASFAGGRCV